jgi:hypothetical protein
LKPHDPLVPAGVTVDSPPACPAAIPADPSALSLDESTTRNQFDASDEVLSATTDKSFSSESVGGGDPTSDSGHGSQSTSSEDITLSFNRGSLRTLKLLEVNPNPGWCWDGKMAKMAQFEGKSYPQLLKMILRASWERIYGCQSSAAMSNGGTTAASTF